MRLAFNSIQSYVDTVNGSFCSFCLIFANRSSTFLSLLPLDVDGVRNKSLKVFRFKFYFHNCTTTNSTHSIWSVALVRTMDISLLIVSCLSPPITLATSSAAFSIFCVAFGSVRFLGFFTVFTVS